MTAKPATHPWLTVIGITAAGYEELSTAAKATLNNATQIIGSQRQLDLVPEDIEGEAKRCPWPTPMAPKLEALKTEKPPGTVILASGDPMCWGIGEYFARQLANDEMHILPAVSVLSLIAARMHWPVAETASLSLCSQPLARLALLLAPGKNIILLPVNGRQPAEIAAYLTSRGYGKSLITILENLGGDDEQSRTMLAEELREEIEIGDLNSLAIALKKQKSGPALTPAPGLPNEAFDHDGQLTRQNIRAITLAQLRPAFGELLWDIGMGNGSIAIEWLRAGGNTRAIGIEQNKDRLDRALKNAENLGVPHLVAMNGKAPESLNDLEPPDAIFIGGGISAPGLLQKALDALKPGGRLVANTVTLEGEVALIKAKTSHGGSLMKFSIEEAEPVGRFQGWRPQMTITQWVLWKS